MRQRQAGQSEIHYVEQPCIDIAVEKISKIDGNVLCGVSGGIDSTVVALLIDKLLEID